MMSEPADHDSKKMHFASQAILALATVAFGLLSIPMGMATIMSPMAFDSDQSVATWVLVVAVASFIPLALISITAAWIVRRQGFYAIAIGIGLLPLINLLILAIMFTSR